MLLVLKGSDDGVKILAGAFLNLHLNDPSEPFIIGLIEI